jgi:N6-L-threonylcarbamoyladenine synthase
LSPLNPPKPARSIILGIESSCDDTAASLLCDGKILANVTASQKVHEQYGGVVPELASRAHQSNIIPVIHLALEKAQISIDEVNAVAVTQGPGLMGSLLVGTNIAKGICIANNIPLIGINHLEAHVAALFIDHQVNLPMLCLLVSGGHTQIILVNGIDDMQIVGTTQDDAAGEAFDKAAKLLNLGYPGGPLIDQYAKQGDLNKYKFPDSQTQGLDFSFSGIKTSLLYFLRDNLKNDNQFINNELPNICASYQHQIVMSLTKRFASGSLSSLHLQSPCLRLAPNKATWGVQHLPTKPPCRAPTARLKPQAGDQTNTKPATVAPRPPVLSVHCNSLAYNAANQQRFAQTFARHPIRRW